MGITGEIVKSVFAKGPHGHHHHQTRINNAAGKKRWRSSVRSYLCGDSVIEEDESSSVRSSTVAEADLSSFRSNTAAAGISTSSWGGGYITSVRAEEDSASLISSEATVNQPLDENRKEDKQNSAYKLFQQEDAALIIQSAFRAFLAKRAQDKAKIADDKNELSMSPSRESISTSIEVQTGNSSDIFSIKGESFDLRCTMQHRARAQVLKIQEDWDDSTVSSVISKMRIQNRMEAATRRERALAYAFSQQLRICSKRKQNITVKGDEMNMGWSWLERWMAARQPEINLPDDNNHGTAVVRKKMMDASMEEKESCGSNEVSSLFEVGISSAPKNFPRPRRIISKVPKSLPLQNSTSSHLCPKDVKKVHHLEDDKEKRKRPRQPSGNKKDHQNMV